MARGTAQYRFPCWYPLRRCAQLAEKEGPAGEGRSREKTTEFVDGRRYRGVWGNMWNNYAPDGNSIKRQLPKIHSRDKGMGFGNARKGEEMGVREGQVESGEQMRHTSATHRFLQDSPT